MCARRSLRYKSPLCHVCRKCAIIDKPRGILLTPSVDCVRTIADAVFLAGGDRRTINDSLSLSLSRGD